MLKTSFALVVQALVGLSVVMAPHALADDQAYLDELAAYGFTINSEDSSMALKLGHFACDSLEQGASNDEVADVIYKATPAFTEKQSENIVFVAQMKLCPDTLGQ